MPTVFYCHSIIFTLETQESLEPNQYGAAAKPLLELQDIYKNQYTSLSFNTERICLDFVSLSFTMFSLILTGSFMNFKARIYCFAAEDAIFGLHIRKQNNTSEAVTLAFVCISVIHTLHTFK